jgi:hypothetical protein
MVVDAGRATAEDSKSSVERKAERATMMCVFCEVLLVLLVLGCLCYREVVVK